MNALKRILLFLVCFVVIGAGACFIIVNIGAAAAVRDAGNTAKMGEIATTAGREIGYRYFLPIWLGSLVLSAGIAFRWIGAIIGGAVAGLLYFSFSNFAPAKKPASPSTSPSAPATTALPSSTSGSSTARQRAIQLFPELAIASSPLNQEFLKRYRKYQSENIRYFDDPEWPTALARESKNALTPK